MPGDKTQSEVNRVNAEEGRQDAEDLRQEADKERGSAEGHRVLAEAARGEAEQFRVLAEEARVLREQYREELESIRQERETLRHACEQPTCAEVCPADAIKRTADGVVQSARKPRCIACGNCVVACPFGVPELYEDRQIMMKCDMCYDRSSVGKKPMCATVCPSQALFFGTREQIEQLRPLSTPIKRFQFGSQIVSTRVFMMVPRALASQQPYVDVTAAMEERPRERSVVLRVVPAEASPASRNTTPSGAEDPFAEVAI